MNSKDYQILVNKYKPKEHRIKNAIIAFLSGGLLGFLGQVLSSFLVNKFNVELSLSYVIVSIIIIFLSCLFTGMGFFDNLIRRYKCGLIVPTSGFAHSMASAIIDYKHEGLVTGIGSNAFKLAGSVILYGIVSAIIFCLIKVVLL